jgi:hypothetical protein
VKVDVAHISSRGNERSRRRVKQRRMEGSERLEGRSLASAASPRVGDLQTASRLETRLLELSSIASSRDTPTHLLFIHFLFPLHQLHIIKTRPHCNMDRSLDEIISERPVWQRHTYPLACTIAHCSSSSAAVVAAVALDADPTDAPLLLPEDLAGRKVPEMASER